MLKRFGGSGLGSSPFGDEEEDPMAGVSNLSDAMLVLAVGFMLALITNWNIEVSSTGQLTEVRQDALTEVGDYDSLDEDDVITSEEGMVGLEEKGTVYMDPETGKIYVIVDEE